MMLFIALWILQVLHPDIFAKLIRPQEPHVDLISSLVSEAGHVHIRRVAISLVVYLTLMLLLVYVPLLQLVACCHALGVSPHFDFTFWYAVPEVQLPLELMLSHICFLSVLDTRKDVIGRVQHVALVFLTEKLGLQRMLIPFAQIRSSVCRSHSRCGTC
jgi:E3 ubiquitin-protein ligase MARCH6